MTESELEREIWRLSQMVDCRENKLRLANQQMLIMQQKINELQEELKREKARNECII